MNKTHEFATELGRQVAGGAEEVLAAYREDGYADENAVSTALCRTLARRLSGTVRGVTVDARATENPGAPREGGVAGADVAVRFGARFHDFAAETGVLLQAKREESPAFDDVPRLVEQCRRMLRVTPAAFVVVYAERGLTFLPARAVVAAETVTRDYRNELYFKGPEPFFVDLFTAFVGDDGLFDDAETLTAFLDDHEIRHGLDVSVGPEQAELADFG